MAEPDLKEFMSWKPWKLDVATELKSEVKPKFIKLHPMLIELVVSIDDKSAAELKKDPKFMASMLGLCKSHSKAALQKMKSVLTDADKQAAGFTSDAQMAGMFLRPIHMEMEKYFDDSCEDIQKEVGNLFAKKRKEEEYLKKASIKIDLDLKFDGLEIPQKGGEKKKVVGGGAVKLPALDIDLDKDIDLTNLRKLIIESGTIAHDVQEGLGVLAKQKVAEDEAAPDQNKDQTKKIDGAITKTTSQVNQLIADHKKALDEVVQEWKQLARPLKEADRLIQEWEDDVADNKSSFPPAVKSSIQSELSKVKKWSLPLTKYRNGLASALKDAGINKKLTEARDQVLAGKATGGEALADEVEEWSQDVQKQLKAFDQELKKSAKVLDECVKRITKLASQKS
jgi:hypothetical protein